MRPALLAYEFPACTLWQDQESGRCETWFCETGATSAATLVPNDYEYAARWGFRDAIEHKRCHELLHHCFARWQGLPYSAVVWADAHHLPQDPLTAGREEAVVLDLTRWLMQPGWTSTTLIGYFAGVRWEPEVLREELQGLMWPEEL